METIIALFEITGIKNPPWNVPWVNVNLYRVMPRIHLEYASLKNTLMPVSYLPAQGLNGQCNWHSVLKRKAHVSRDSPNASRRRMDCVSHYVRNFRSKMLVCCEPLSVCLSPKSGQKNIPYNHESVILPKRKRFRNGWLKPTTSDPEKGGFQIKL